MDMDASPFRVLLAEDDPVSRAFLAETIRACGAEVQACADGGTALALARSRNWDLLILDHHLPGRDGDAVLGALRAEPDAASHATPAIATSAARDAESASLLRAGFAEVLPKPMTTETLRAALRRQGCPVVESTFDDDDALRACGSAAAVTRLRKLFAEQELPRVQDELDGAGNQPELLRPTLHRLQASCGFCGARTLAAATATLQRALSAGADSGQVQAALRNFRDALASARATLRAVLEDSDA
jgi:CheY-like chemotaxis protein